MTRAKINPIILKWARSRVGLSETQVAKKIGLGEKPQRVQAWEQGEAHPTFRQAQNLARVLQIPFGYLFISNPPEIDFPVTDFRTLPEAQRGQFSPELEDVLNDMLRKRDWLRERHLQEGHQPLPFIGRFSTQSAPEEISEDIRQTLGLSAPTAKDAKSWSDHLRILVRQAEKAGIMVLQSGYALRNTRRTLSVLEFRGLTLVDSYAPLIFINSKDSINGRIFTLAHELGHIWTGASGISNPDMILPEKEMLAIERLCNQVAAELLVPSDLLGDYWQGRPINEGTMGAAARIFRVSVFVILIRSYELGYLQKNIFRNLYNQAQQDAQSFTQTATKKSSGGNFYNTFPVRNGRLLLREVSAALSDGSLLYREASQLLNVKPKTLENALQKI